MFWTCVDIYISIIKVIEENNLPPIAKNDHPILACHFMGKSKKKFKDGKEEIQALIELTRNVVQKPSTWYFNVPQCFVKSWGWFEMVFLMKFREDKTPYTLVLEISKIKMDNKEKIKDSHQTFTIFLNKIPVFLDKDMPS